MYAADVLTAIELIECFVGAKTFEEYEAEMLLVSAVERQLSIVGEAVTQLKKLLPEGFVSNATQIIGFRNILIIITRASAKRYFRRFWATTCQF